MVRSIELSPTGAFGTWVDVTDFIPMSLEGVREFPLTIVQQADGAVPEYGFNLVSEFSQGATLHQLSSILTGGPVAKQHILDHDGSSVYFAGRINGIEFDPSGPQGIKYALTGTSYVDELLKPIGYFEIPAQDNVVYNGETFHLTRDTHRVKYLFAHFLPSWDHTTYIPDAAYATFTYTAGYYKTNVLDILKDIASWAGPNILTPLNSRSWYVTADWAAGVTNKYIAYFSRAGGTGSAPYILTTNAPSAISATLWDARRIVDPARMVNGIIIAGPNGEPSDVSFDEINAVNTEVSTNTVTKTAGTHFAYDAGAFAEQYITSEGGYIEAVLPYKQVIARTVTTTYSAGDFVLGDSGSGTNIIYKCTTAGTTGSGVITWPVGAGTTVADGTVTWTNYKFRTSFAYVLGDYIVPTTPNGFFYRVTVAGTSAGSEPGSYSTTEGGTTTSGGVTFMTSTYHNVALGFSTTDTNQDWATILTGVRTLGGVLQVIYLGTVVLANAGTYGEGTRIRIELLRVGSSDGTPYWELQVFRDTGSGFERRHLNRFLYSQMDDGTHGGTNRFPLRPDFSLATLDASITSIIYRRHSYSTHQREDSVDTYGEFWASEVFKDDNLDTVEKRQRKAEQIFDRRAYPRNTFVCTTNSRTTGAQHHLIPGKVVAVTVPKFGWSLESFIVTRVTTDWTYYGDIARPVQHLELGDRLLEDGEEDDVFWLSRIADSDKQAPPIPTGLYLKGSGMEGYTTAWANMAWDALPEENDVRFIWLRFILEDPNPPRRHPEYPFDARFGREGMVRGLLPGRKYRVQIAAEDYNTNRSAYSVGVRISLPERVPTDRMYNPTFALANPIDETIPDGFTITVAGLGTPTPAYDTSAIPPYQFSGARPITWVMPASATASVIIESDWQSCNNPNVFGSVGLIQETVQYAYHAKGNIGAAVGSIRVQLIGKDRNGTETAQDVLAAVSPADDVDKGSQKKKTLSTNAIFCKVRVTILGSAVRATTWWVGALDCTPAITSPQVGSLNISSAPDSDGDPLILTNELGGIQAQFGSSAAASTHGFNIEDYTILRTDTAGIAIGSEHYDPVLDEWSIESLPLATKMRLKHLFTSLLIDGDNDEITLSGNVRYVASGGRTFPYPMISSTGAVLVDSSGNPILTYG